MFHAIKKRNKKSDYRWVAFLLPVILGSMYIALYFFVPLNIYGKTVGPFYWLLEGPNKLMTVFRDSEGEPAPAYINWAIKTAAFLLRIGFIASIFYAGWIIHYKKPQYNDGGMLRDNDAYLKAVEIKETVKLAKGKEAEQAKTAVRLLAERLKNESTFGVGNDSVISCENEIAKSLQAIEENVKALSDEKTAEDAAEVIVADCRKIQAQLKIRTELKKR